MGRKLRVAVGTKAPQVDDSPDAGPGGGIGEVPGRTPIVLFEILGALHEVDKVEGGINTLEGSVE